jgi:hypothetical protein
MGLNGNGNCNPAPQQPNCRDKPHGDAIGKTGCDPISPNLGFHAVAALLNSAHPSVNFGYTSGELIALFQKYCVTKPQELKNSLVMLNERGCPLN